MPSQYEIFFWGGKQWKVVFSRCRSVSRRNQVCHYHRKPTFSGVYMHFDSVLPATYKFSMIYTSFFRCFSICSNWTNFHSKLVFVKDIFLKGGWPMSFIDECFKTFLGWLYPTFVLSFLWELSLQIRTKLQKVLKGTLGCSKIQIVFKNQMNLSNVFHFKHCFPYDLMSCALYKFWCGRCSASYYGETDRHLIVGSGEHISISPLIFGKVEPSAEGSVRDRLLFCNHNPSFDGFTILAQGLISFY